MKRMIITVLQSLIWMTLVIGVTNSMIPLKEGCKQAFYPLRGSDVFLLVLSTAALSLSASELWERE